MSIHSVKKEKKSSFIVYNGQCDYKVVIPKNAKELETKAAEELVFFFREATGLTLPIVDDESVSYRPEHRFFSIGATRMIERAKIFESQIEIDETLLGMCGARVVTHGLTVFMFGATERGTLNAVYEFLQCLLHFDSYFTDFYTIDREVTRLSFYALDITEVPDIQFHTSGYGYVKGDTAYRFRRGGGRVIPVRGKQGHNAFEYLDIEKNLKAHPAWFDNAEKPHQTCFTAHGDENEFKALVEQSFSVLKEALIECPEYEIVRYAMRDVEETCQCEACQKAYKKYKSKAASVIIFLNQLKKKVDEWFKTEEGKPYARNLRLVFYAYIDYKVAPAYLDEKTGEYLPVDDAVKCVEGVVPMLCFIEMKYSRIPQDKVNKEYYDLIRAWRACANELHFYYYDTNFHYYLTPYDSFTAMREYYQMVIDNNSCFLHNLGQTKNAHPTGFSALKVYLQSKLAWDINADLDAYTDKFFRAFFGPACEPMRKLYDSYRKVAYDQTRKLGYGERRNAEVYAIPLSQKLWKKSWLLEWLEMAKEAMQALSPLIETDFNLYCKYAENVIAERIFIKYLLVELYANDFDEATVREWKISVKADCKYVGITNWNEGQDASYLWKAWGILNA